MSRKKPDLSEEDAALWRQVTHSAAPLKRVSRPAKAIGETPLIRRAGKQTLETGAAPNAPPAERGGEKRVRRGRVDIYGRLDLHGLTQMQARAALLRFVRRAAGEGARTIIVVTGRGGRLIDGEPSPGILKSRLPDWLGEADFRALVSGYAQAHARHGGAGAYYLFLRRPG